MTKNEAGVIVGMISTFYPNEYAKIPPENLKLIVEMWAATCEGYTGKQVSAAFQQYMANDTSGFAPKPGQVIQYIAGPEDERDLTASEAWGLVLRAMSNSIYHAEEEWERLPETVQRAVGTSVVLREMAMMPSDSMGVEESHFRRAYNSELERKRTKRRLPPASRNILEVESRPALEG